MDIFAPWLRVKSLVLLGGPAHRQRNLLCCWRKPSGREADNWRHVMWEGSVSRSVEMLSTWWWLGYMTFQQSCQPLSSVSLQ